MLVEQLAVALLLLITVQVAIYLLICLVRRRGWDRTYGGDLWDSNIMFQTADYAVVPVLINVTLYSLCHYLILLVKLTFDDIWSTRSITCLNCLECCLIDNPSGDRLAQSRQKTDEAQSVCDESWC